MAKKGRAKAYRAKVDSCFAKGYAISMKFNSRRWPAEEKS
jgi:hypothetical protein